jgi:hypothetical protein
VHDLLLSVDHVLMPQNSTFSCLNPYRNPFDTILDLEHFIFREENSLLEDSILGFDARLRRISR